MQPVGVPYDCQDGFYQSYWRRPRGYFDGRVRAGISVFHRLPQTGVASAMKRLSRDLDDGSWEARYGDLLELRRAGRWAAAGCLRASALNGDNPESGAIPWRRT